MLITKVSLFSFPMEYSRSRTPSAGAKDNKSPEIGFAPFRFFRHKRKVSSWGSSVLFIILKDEGGLELELSLRRHLRCKHIGRNGDRL